MNKTLRKYMSQVGVPYRSYSFEPVDVVSGPLAGMCGKLWMIGVSKFDRSPRVLVKLEEQPRDGKGTVWRWFREDEISLVNPYLY